MAQVVALIMIAQVASSGVTSVKVGEFLSMGACKAAAAHAILVGDEGSARVFFECVPLSPVSDGDNRH